MARTVSGTIAPYPIVAKVSTLKKNACRKLPAANAGVRLAQRAGSAGQEQDREGEIGEEVDGGEDARNSGQLIVSSEWYGLPKIAGQPAAALHVERAIAVHEADAALCRDHRAEAEVFGFLGDRHETKR